MPFHPPSLSRLLAEIIVTETHPLNHPLGAVNGGLLRMRGKLCTVTTGDGGSPYSVDLNATQSASLMVFYDQVASRRLYHPNPVVLLAVVERMDFARYREGLILQATGRQRGQYVRIGVWWNRNYEAKNPFLKTKESLESFVKTKKLNNDEEDLHTRITDAFNSITVPPSGYEEEDREAKAYTISII
ncbi:hypothetical protein EPUS_07093 [Endocarpon pusillum Z07020]|uniref:Uncharacterized protein n=1 Tax=Endocarpon pusillum (strain Z07020 / HMAS-L-300199) TaxID=1263415 RepID=U1HZN4_ENDPU|nr:uncharacterized protein EPUS_07093 [Endocarpon pusillum Z07020]ERF76385.1 hypothetical protein EPUS_07093 [Endocarpon pusillum Z07020]